MFDSTLERFSILPAVDSYLITPRAASKLATAFLPVRFATHIHLTYLVQLLGLRVYHAVPNVFVDGSKLGALTSSLDSNNRLLWSQAYCQAEALIQDKAATLTQAELDTALSSVPLADHPDVMALRGTALAARGDARGAEAMFSKAYAAYEKDNCLLDMNCKFLRAYMAIHRDLQDDV